MTRKSFFTTLLAGPLAFVAGVRAKPKMMQYYPSLVMTREEKLQLLRELTRQAKLVEAWQASDGKRGLVIVRRCFLMNRNFEPPLHI